MRGVRGELICTHVCTNCSSVATGKKDLKISMRPRSIYIYIFEYMGSFFPGFEFAGQGNHTSLRGTLSSAVAEFSVISLRASVLEQKLKSSN